MKHYLALTLATCLVWTGCATVKTTPEDFSKMQANAKKASPYIRASAAAAVQLGLLYGEKNPEKRAEVSNQINVASTNLAALLAAGQVDPDAVTTALKIEENYVNTIIETVAILYRAKYEELEQNGHASLAIGIAQDLLAGLKDGTAK